MSFYKYYNVSDIISNNIEIDSSFYSKNKFKVLHSLNGPAQITDTRLTWAINGKIYISLDIKYPLKNSKEFRELYYTCYVLLSRFGPLNFSMLSSAINYCELQFQKIRKLENFQ